MTRYQANKCILDYLQEYNKKNPRLRFNQMLINLGIVTRGGDDFYVESVDVMKKIINYLYGRGK